MSVGQPGYTCIVCVDLGVTPQALRNPEGSCPGTGTVLMIQHILCIQGFSALLSTVVEDLYLHVTSILPAAEDCSPSSRSMNIYLTWLTLRQDTAKHLMAKG